MTVIIQLPIPVLLRRTKYDIFPEGPKNERNCNILSLQRQFFLLHINFETNFQKIYKKAEGRVNLLRCIHPKVVLATFIVVLNVFST